MIPRTGTGVRLPSHEPDGEVRMIELVLLVCLASDPTKCHKEWPPFESSQMSMHACMFEGQRLAVQWADAHPKYRVRKWSCGLTGS